MAPSDQIPPAQRAWSCPECSKGLPTLPKHWHQCSIQEHFKAERPHTNPTDAYHNKQRNDLSLRERMSSRGKHAGSVKAAEAKANLSRLTEETDHVLTYVKLLHDPTKHII